MLTPSPGAGQPKAPGKVAAAPADAKGDVKKSGTVIPGTKPGQIVDLQLWRNRPGKEGAQAPAPTETAAAPAPTTKSTVSTPDNDPAVRLARDQLESSFK